jgi:hypothetical protein
MQTAILKLNSKLPPKKGDLISKAQSGRVNIVIYTSIAADDVYVHSAVFAEIKDLELTFLEAKRSSTIKWAPATKKGWDIVKIFEERDITAAKLASLRLAARRSSHWPPTLEQE